MSLIIQAAHLELFHEGEFGGRIFKTEMLEDQMIDAVATDAHNVTSRRARMAEAYDILEKNWGKSYADQLTNGGVLRNMD